MPREQLEFLHQMQDTLDNLEFYYHRQERNRLNNMQMRGISEAIRQGNFPPTIISGSSFFGATYNYIGGRVYTTREAEVISTIFPQEIIDRISNWDSFELNAIHDEMSYTSNLCNAWLIDSASRGWSLLTYSCLGCSRNHTIQGERVEE